MKKGLALSGGGFRATLFHLGVISFLRAAGLLKEISHITSVSGGSILAAHLVLNWELYTDSDEAFQKAAGEIIKAVRADIRGSIYRRVLLYAPFKLIPNFAGLRVMRPVTSLAQAWRKSTTDLLVKYYSEYLFGTKTLIDLNPEGEQRPQLYLLTTNLNEGSLWSFTPKGFYNEDTGHESIKRSFSLSRAVAASSAFPGLFPPVTLTPPEITKDRVRLTDGGVYDNLGVRKFHNLFEEEQDITEVFVSDASSPFAIGDNSGILEPLRTAIRASDILSKRIHELESDQASDEIFKVIEIEKSIDEKTDKDALFTEHQIKLKSVRTDLDEFSELEILCLIRQGFCAARAALISEVQKNSKNQVPAEVEKRINELRDLKPWDPLPKSSDADVLAVKKKDSGSLGRIERKLQESAYRKLRLFSFKDKISYLYLALLAFTVFCLIYKPHNTIIAPFEDESKKEKIASSIPTLRKEYKRILLDRRYELQDSAGFLSLARDVTQVPVETWTTSQVAYALLKSGEIESQEELDFIIKAIRNRFVVLQEEQRRDWEPTNQGWFTRPSQRVLQAEPALWTAAAIAALLQRGEIDEVLRGELISKLNNIYKYLADKKYIYHANDNDVAFNIFANQQDQSQTSPYTTALALMTLLEIRRSNQFLAGIGAKQTIHWGDKNLDDLINAIVNWLNSQYDQDKFGWRGITHPIQRNDPSEGFTLQTLSVLLETYRDLGKEVPSEVEERCRRHLRALGKNPNRKDTVGRTFLYITNHEGKGQNVETSITFLWRPWAIKLCLIWLDKIENSSSAEEKLLYRNILHELIFITGLEEVLKNDNQDYTFVSAEMLLAVSVFK